MRKKRNEQGSIMVWFAFLLPVLLGCTGLAIDTGHMYLQKTNLENVARAAALGGVSGETSGVCRLITDPRTEEDTSAFSIEIDGTQYNFTRVTENTVSATDSGSNKKSGYDQNADIYVNKNIHDASKASMLRNSKSTELWQDETNNAYCYFVTLTDTVPAFFMRILGMGDSTIDATAVAAVIPSQSLPPSVVDAQTEVAAENVINIIPNYIWESIAGDNGYNKFTVTNTNDGNSKTEKATIGQKKGQYFATDYVTYIKEYTTTEVITDYSVASYKDRDVDASNPLDMDAVAAVGPSVSVPYCADVIPAASTQNDFRQLLNLVWTFDSTLASKIDFSKTTAMFIDRPNKSHSSPGSGYPAGWQIRNTIIRITSDDLGGDATVPLFLRVESEPPTTGSIRGITIVQPITVQVKGTQEKPMVIAYDGPDSRRIWSDAPYVNYKKPEYIFAYDEGYIKKGGVPEYKLSSITTSPPFTLQLDADFNGVIYAPRSVVTIQGSGKIKGFVLARKIILDGDAATVTGRTMLNDQKLTIPALTTLSRGTSKLRADYTKGYTDEYFSIVYDTFFNYTSSL